MARRTQPSQAALFGPGARGPAPPPENEGALARFAREQLFAPDKLPGNISLVTGLAVFFGGIAAVRTWGELMVPA